MLRLALFSFHRRRLVLGAWIGALLAVGIAVGTIGTGYSDEFTLPHTESSRALDLLTEKAPNNAGDQITAVVAVDSGSVTGGVAKQRFEKALAVLAADKELVAGVASPYGAPDQVSADKRVAFATVTLTGSVPNDISSSDVLDLVDKVTAEAGDGVQIEVTGNAAQAQPPQGKAELVGLVAAAVVLFLVFGSLVAMSLPLITAVLSIGLSLGIAGIVANALTVATFAPILAALLGLGVGVDYALFMVTRARQELQAGRTPEEATRIAVDTSGRAVLFAGITVCIALMGMFALGISFLYGVAVTASLAVGMTVFASLTLLPAMLGFAGRKVLPKKQRDPALVDPGAVAEESARWQSWTRVLDRRPKLIAGLALLVMAVIAIPFFSLRLGITDQGSGPKSDTTRKGYDLLAQGFGAGFNGPLLLVTEVGADPTTTATDRVRAALADDADVARVLPTVWVGGTDATKPTAGGVGITTVYPKGAPQDASTSRLVDTIRKDIVPAAEQGTGNQVLVAGGTAIFEDFSNVITGKLPLFIGIVVLLSFLLLTMVFRSIVVALVAAVMNLVSIAAAFGVVVAVFQWGWGLSLIGVDRTGPILSFLPVILFAILFGLSMDYEVFLLSRIHEEWVKRGNNRDAVMHGLAATGRTISAAAAIMVMLFMAFVFGPDSTIKLFGLGLASAVLLDAIVIRSVLVPGLMLALGKANWYLPAWLDRALPHLAVEGTSHHDDDRDDQPELARV